MKALRIAGAVVGAILAIAYPIAIFVGLTRLGARAVSLWVLALLIPSLAWRFRNADRATRASVVRLPLAMLVLVGAGALTDDPRFVLALPVLINGVLLVEFGASLRAGSTPMIERFARMQEPDLDAPKQRHCRRWTVIWCVFFALNGLLAGVLALAAPLFLWTLYTGAIAYAVMGALFAAEWIERRLRFGALPAISRESPPPTRPGS